MTLSRRNFLGKALAGGAMVSLAPGVSGCFGKTDAKRDILVVLFLRFGCDGLAMVAPADDANYRDARPTLAVAETGPNAGLPIGALDGLPFFFHPAIPELKALYDAGHLAVVHAAGLETDSRSHFVSQDKMDRAIADGERPLSGGWVARHLIARKIAPHGLSAVSSGSAIDVSLQNYSGAIAVPDITLFDITNGDLNFRLLKRLNAGSGAVVPSAVETLATIEVVRAKVAKLPRKSENPAGYTDQDFSKSLRSLATIIKMDMGLEVATVDYGGWDHHVTLNAFFPGQARELALGLKAFWTDLAAYRDRLTLVTVTEFGRRVAENANAGTDHGAASFMFVLGGAVNGGRIYGQWPGLKPADLHAGDLRITTDYRQVLREILVKRRGETTPQAVFPTLQDKPLGVVRAST